MSEAYLRSMLHPAARKSLLYIMKVDIELIVWSASNQSQRKRGPHKKKLHLTMLHYQKVEADFQAGLHAKLEHSSNPPDSSPETIWEQLKSAILQTSVEVVGLAKRKNKDWFHEYDAAIRELLSKKRSTDQAHLSQPSCKEKKTAFCRACSNLQHSLREIQNLVESLTKVKQASSVDSFKKNLKTHLYKKLFG